MKIFRNRNSCMPVITFAALSYMLRVMLLVSAKEAQHEPTDINFFTCGGSTSLLPYDQRWSYKNSSSNRYGSNYLTEANATTMSRASIQSSIDQRYTRLYACIYKQQYSHPIALTPGMKFIRLHFYPTSYYGLEISKALFSVTVGRYTVLNTSLSTSWMGNSNFEYTVKEICVNIEGPVLNITFDPARNSPGAYAFVNQIEVVSVPQDLYIRGDVLLPIIGHNHSESYLIGYSIALETMYRLNVGGDSISPEGDTGMFRTWAEDTPFMMYDEISCVVQWKGELTYSSSVPEYTAPLKVYTTARITFRKLTWVLPIDSGFFYLVRLHFCEIKGGATVPSAWAFQIYMNNQTADVLHWTKGSRVPVYHDYVVNFSRNSHSMRNLSVEILGDVGKGPAFLNGLEIFKLSDNSHNLAGISPFQKGIFQDKKSIETGTKVIRGFMLGLFAIAFFCIIWTYFDTRCQESSLCQSHCQRRALMQFRSLGCHCRYFSLAEIKSATNNFSDDNLIGEGGFGKVYKGKMNVEGGITSVAIKRGSPTSHQGSHEFQTEITMLTKLRNLHLVSLIGCCMDDKEMILVYDFMDQGTLRSHLYNTHKPPLPWKKRLKICIDAARGLHYLHLGIKPMIIHRDVKTTNILLDKGWVAKVSDFGLSKFGPTMSHAHVSTVVKGTFGYLDPEYYRYQKLTEKSDIYSFGVVLMEVLCGRPAVLPIKVLADEEEDEIEKVNLAEWALHCYQMGKLDQIVDPYLKGMIDPECFKTFTEIARKCLGDRGSERPSMGDVVWNLELAWQQQEAARKEEEERANFGRVAGEVVMTIDAQLPPCIGNSDLTPGVEFSELMTPIGR